MEGLVDTRPPIALSDLDKRLALLTRHGVRSYRDGLLSIELDVKSKKSVRDEFPEIPEG